MNDLISRKAAIERAKKDHDFFRGATIPTDKARRDELLNVICWLGELPPAEPEVVRCKDCKNRGIVNICPFSGYVTVAKKTDSRGTDTLPLPYDYGETQIQTYCNARDNDFCSRAERRQDARSNQ